MTNLSLIIAALHQWHDAKSFESSFWNTLYYDDSKTINFKFKVHNDVLLPDIY